MTSSFQVKMHDATCLYEGGHIFFASNSNENMTNILNRLGVQDLKKKKKGFCTLHHLVKKNPNIQNTIVLCQNKKAALSLLKRKHSFKEKSIV